MMSKLIQHLCYSTLPVLYLKINELPDEGTRPIAKDWFVEMHQLEEDVELYYAVQMLLQNVPPHSMAGKSVHARPSSFRVCF